jgi:hypothetical protein
MTGFDSKRQMAQDKVAQPVQEPPIDFELAYGELYANQRAALAKALAQPVQEPDELTIAYMSGLYDGKKKRPWVGLTAEEAAECWTTSATQTWKNFEAKLKEKNFD